MRNKLLGICAWLIMLSIAAAGQLSIQPLFPQSGLIRKAQLMDISVVYLKDDQTSVALEIHLKDRLSGQSLFLATTSTVQLQKGAHVWSASILEPLIYTGISSLRDNGAGLIPVGEYEVCYRIYTADLKTELLNNDCYAFDAEAMAPPMLSFPLDSAVLESSYPVFQWLPPSPILVFPDLNYDIIISPIFPGQSAEEAIQRNTPLYNAGGIRQNMLQYPSGYSIPEIGKLYAWQIVARNGESFGAKTETWVFSIAERKEQESRPISSLAYAKLSKKIFDAIYTPDDEIRFEFSNEKQDEVGKAQIYQVNKEGKVILAKNDFKLRAGQNYISWKVSLPRSEQKEQILILKIDLESGDSWGCQLRIPQAK